MQTWIGLTLLTGLSLIDKKGCLDTYWSRDKTLATPIFNEKMPRNRYQLIGRLLHCVDNTAEPQDCTDKLYKIRPMYDLLRTKWNDLYTPGEYISIDEGTLK
jgi:hypothetical protein